VENSAEAIGNAQIGLANANVSKIEISPSLQFEFNSPGESSFLQRVLDGARKGINPIKFARRQAEIRKIEANSEAEIASILRQAYPSFTDNQIALYIYGYTTTPAEADNIIDVLHRTNLELAEPTMIDRLNQDCIDQDIKGAATAYEEELRIKWANLIASEATTGVPYGKRCKQLLGMMDTAEAKCFDTLCGYVLWTNAGPLNEATPIPVTWQDEGENWTRNSGALNIDALANLESLGLIKNGEWITFTLQANKGMTLDSPSTRALVVNETNSIKQVTFGEIRFLKPGAELAKALQRDVVPNMENHLKRVTDLHVIYGPRPDHY